MSPALVLHCFHYCKRSGPQGQLQEVLNKNKGRVLASYLKSFKANYELELEPLREIVFKSYLNENRYVVKSKFTLKLLSIVSIVVLLMAWMNYVNLTISRTKKRFKEMAARKVSGASARDLFIQFVSQSFLINLLSVFVGVTILQLVKTPFQFFFNIHSTPFQEYTAGTFVFFGLVFASGVFGCAAYPAWVCSSFTTRQLLGYNITTQKRLLPSILTTFQYTAALVLLILILVNHAQLGFILSKDLGIEKDDIIVIEAPVVGLEENGVAKMIRFVEQLRSSTNSRVTLSGRVPGDYSYTAIVRKTGSDIACIADTYGGTDENFLPFYKLKLLAGRNFQKDEKPDVVLLSEHVTRRLNFKSPEEAVGSFVEVNNYDEPFTKAEVIGVFSDYRVTPFFTSQNSSEDLTGRGQCFAYLNNLWKEDLPERVSAKVTLSQADEFIRKAAKVYAESFPGNAFVWYFIDDHITRHYKQQKILRNQISFFTLLAIGVACLGLVGMVANRVADKTKEISIRKILGAHYVHIASILLDSTAKQIMIAVLLGIPIAWKLSREFLTRYSERIDLQWWHYGIPVLVLLGILMATVASLLWKAARNNPVDALKSE
jgi:putative ABC transport system permease protein